MVPLGSYNSQLFQYIIYLFKAEKLGELSLLFTDWREGGLIGDAFKVWLMGNHGPILLVHSDPTLKHKRALGYQLFLKLCQLALGMLKALLWQDGAEKGTNFLHEPLCFDKWIPHIFAEG